MVQRLVQVALVLSCLQCAYSQQSSATSAGVYDGQVSDAARTCTPHMYTSHWLESAHLLCFDSTRQVGLLCIESKQSLLSTLCIFVLCSQIAVDTVRSLPLPSHMATLQPSAVVALH